MGRLIEETELEKYIMHNGCEKGCGYIDERDLKYIPTAEAITKYDYENRLKADMVAMFEELNLEIDEMFARRIDYTVDKIQDLIQQKINALKEASDA